MIPATLVQDKLAIPAWIHYLALAGHHAPSADNSQPWRFIWNEQNLSLVFDSIRGKGALDRNHPVVQMAFGAVIENMVQAAVAAKLEVANWDYRYLISENGPFLVIPAPTHVWNHQQLPEQIINRHTNRGKYFQRRISDEIVSELSNQTEGNATIRVYNDPKTIKKLAKFVRKASEIRFQTEEAHHWLEINLRFTEDEADRGDGLDVETLALPPGGKKLLKFISDWRRMAALNRVHFYKLLAFIEGVQFEQCGGVVTIVGSGVSNSPVNWVSAGRLMERAWLLLSRKGISVHPYFVLPDLFYRLESNRVPMSLKEKARDIADSYRNYHELRNQSLFMMMRVGTAKCPPKYSKRLPLLDGVLLHQEAITANKLVHP